MTLPVASNAISLSDVNTELGFGATAAISLNDAAVRTLAEVPSGDIRLATDLWGKTAVTLAISNQFISDFGTVTTAASISLTSSGTVTFATGWLGSGTLENWITPQTNMSDYSIRAHVDSGSTPTGSALDTDLALSSTHTWTIAQTGTGFNAATLTMTLKRIADGVTMDTATYDLSVTTS